jgi:hypothetical protein
LANDDAEEEKAIFFRGFFYAPARFVVRASQLVARLLCAISLHFATLVRPRLKFWNESGTNRARIADSSALRLRSPQHLALTPDGGTRSSLAQRDKGRIGVEFLKFETGAESNQK